MTNQQLLPVLSSNDRDAEIIGHARTVEEAEGIIRQSFIDAGNDDQEMAALAAAGRLTANKRLALLAEGLDSIEPAEIEHGYWSE